MADQVKEKETGKTGVALADAKQYLQKNDLKEIAEKAKLTRGQVSNVLYGRSKNFKVVALILERAEKNKALTERAEAL